MSGERYASLQAFYEGNPARRTSGEADYGVWWMDGQPWPRYRVSYVQWTGEIYALELRGGMGGVEVLGVVPPDKGDGSYYQTLDRILDGWTEHIHEPDGLAWVRERLQGAAA